MGAGSQLAVCLGDFAEDFHLDWENGIHARDKFLREIEIPAQLVETWNSRTQEFLTTIWRLESMMNDTKILFEKHLPEITYKLQELKNYLNSRLYLSAQERNNFEISFNEIEKLLYNSLLTYHRKLRQILKKTNRSTQEVIKIAELAQSNADAKGMCRIPDPEITQQARILYLSVTARIRKTASEIVDVFLSVEV